MRSSLERSRTDRRDRVCGNGKPPCPLAPADGPNPLGLCPIHLAAYREVLGGTEPGTCPACTPFVIVREDGKHWHPAGRMCFACGLTVGGTVATEQHRAEARIDMRARMLVLWRTGDRGAEWTALLARCPPEIREAFERRIAAVTQPEP